MHNLEQKILSSNKIMMGSINLPTLNCLENYFFCGQHEDEADSLLVERNRKTNLVIWKAHLCFQYTFAIIILEEAEAG